MHSNILHSQYDLQIESLQEQLSECPENALLAADCYCHSGTKSVRTSLQVFKKMSCLELIVIAVCSVPTRTYH